MYLMHQYRRYRLNVLLRVALEKLLQHLKNPLKNLLMKVKQLKMQVMKAVKSQKLKNFDFEEFKTNFVLVQ